MNNLKGRLANRVQLTTDGHHAYLRGVKDSFGGEVDFAQLIKFTAPRETGSSLQPGNLHGD